MSLWEYMYDCLFVIRLGLAFAFNISLCGSLPGW